VRVEWTERALGHVRAIYAYIGDSSELYARRTADRLLARAEQLREFPLSGRMVPEYERPEVRELVEGPYRILYRYREGDDVALVLGVIHGRQRLPAR
jgi:toxin ParE1/3/4